MFNKKSMSFLEKLMLSSSPTGYEAQAAKIFRDYLSDCCEVKCDVMPERRDLKPLRQKRVEKGSFRGIWVSLKLPVCSFTTPERQIGWEEDLTALGTSESAS